MKKYGATTTNLKLTEKAEKIYSVTEPCEIIEHETEDGYRYSISGIIEAENLTNEQINEIFLEMGNNEDKL